MDAKEWLEEVYTPRQRTGEELVKLVKGARLIIEAQNREITELSKANEQLKQKVNQRWVAVTERLPTIYQGKVLCTNGKEVFHAEYVPQNYIFTMRLDDDADADKIGRKYWPEGWYEWNDCEKTHWKLDNDITHWMPLPDVPKEESND